MVRRALVTGATGGLGRVLVPVLLAAGYQVRATGRDPVAGESLAAIGAQVALADLCDPANAAALVKDIDLVIHAAALSKPWGDPQDFELINVRVTVDLLDAAKQAACNHFVYISTPSIYAEERDRLDLTEESPHAIQFANDYVRTKYAAEQLVLAAHAPGLACSVLRPRAVIGPHDRTLLPRLKRIARTGYFPLFRGGRALIDITDARDVAEAILATDRKVKTAGGRAYNITGGAPITVAALLDIAFEALDLAPRRVEVAFRPAVGVVRGLEALCARLPGRPEPPATAYTLGVLAFSQTFDLTVVRRDLGWAPRHSPKETIAWAAEGLNAAV